MLTFRRIAPFLLLGPITGPLIAGVFYNLRGGRPYLAGLYAVAATTVTIGLPLITARLGLPLIMNNSLPALASALGVHIG